MFNDNQKNASCRFADEIVSYLYDEIGKQEKLDFQSHLADCASCAEEIDGFSLVRSSVQQWRAEDFAGLPTPVFEIPSAKTLERDSSSLSWFEQIRAFLLLSPNSLTRSAAFAVLAICAGLAFFVFNSLPDRDVAQSVKEPAMKANASPTAAAEAGGRNSVVSEGNKDDNQQTGSSKPLDLTEIKGKSDAKKAFAAPAKTSFRVRAEQPSVDKQTGARPKRSASAKAEKEAVKISPKPGSKQPALPDLTDIEEDNSLRLSDIFAEISMR